MFLINDDQTKIGDGKQNWQMDANNKQWFLPQQCFPKISFFLASTSRMEAKNLNIGIQLRFHEIGKLQRKRNFRQEQQDRFALRDSLLNKPLINLSFSRTSNAVNERWRKLRRDNVRHDAITNFLLLISERNRFGNASFFTINGTMLHLFLNDKLPYSFNEMDWIELIIARKLHDKGAVLRIVGKWLKRMGIANGEINSGGRRIELLDHHSGRNAILNGNADDAANSQFVRPFFRHLI